MKLSYIGSVLPDPDTIHTDMGIIVGDALNGVGIEGHVGKVTTNIWLDNPTQQNQDDVDSGMSNRGFTKT